jgi:hypothetical protein
MTSTQIFRYDDDPGVAPRPPDQSSPAVEAMPPGTLAAAKGKADDPDEEEHDSDEPQQVDSKAEAREQGNE